MAFIESIIVAKPSSAAEFFKCKAKIKEVIGKGKLYMKAIGFINQTHVKPKSLLIELANAVNCSFRFTSLM